MARSNIGDQVPRARVPTGFLNKTLELKNRARAYAVYVPRDYDPAREWPLILFLHGAGERGDDGLKPTEVGIGRAIRRHPDRYPALVVFPQCPDGEWWDAAAIDIEGATEEIIAEYNIDKNRVYLTGLSMGGYAAWTLAARRPEVWAALVPICGGIHPSEQIRPYAQKLATLPIWAFHGRLDDVVLPAESRQIVEAIKSAGGDIRYTEFKDAAHNSWDPAYGNKELTRWLFKHQRR